MSKTAKIGTRLPNGLRLQVSDWVDTPEGGKQLKTVAIYDIPGSGRHHGAVAGGLAPEEHAGYVEIPSDHAAKWFEMNKDSDLVTSGAVFRGKANAETEEAPADPVQAEAEAQRAILGEQKSADPKAEAEAAKGVTRAAKVR